MARTSKPRDASRAGDASAATGRERPRDKPATSGRRSATPPRPATGEPEAEPARTGGRGRRRGQGGSATATKPARVEPPVQVTAPPGPANADPAAQPFAEVASELRQLRLELAEALPLLGAVPRQVN